MEDFTRVQIAPNVFQLKDRMDFCATLVIGKERALLFDAMSGTGDLPAYLRTLTSLPLTVVCSHSHFDHVGGCGAFEPVWLSPLERPLPECAPFPSLPLQAGQIFDLGGRTLQAVALPGHTGGSMGLLLPDCDLLLSGDAMTPIMCLFFPDSLPLEDYQKTLRYAMGLPFRRFLTGHMTDTLPRTELAQFLAAAEAVPTLRAMPFQYDFFPQYTGRLYLYREGPRQSDLLGVILPPAPSQKSKG